VIIRTGIGYDIHRLELGHKLILGGVDIPFHKGHVAHSDGDTLIHSIIDSLLGAAALGDIGQFFPDTDDKYKNADSIELLRKTVQMIFDKRFSIVNVDSTIILEEPKMAPYIPQMLRNLVNAIGISIENISVKAKTNEGLGAIGSGEATACITVVTIESEKR
jgi:2-C-methyl-D-erythritol 2,4-cyclodiphosphate synthase